MIEKIIISYLNNELGVPVYAEIPANPPKEFVIVHKLDGGVTNHVNEASIYFESYSDSLQKAAELNERVQALLFESVSLDEISSAKLGGEGSNIDTNTKRYRYESVFNFYYYK